MSNIQLYVRGITGKTIIINCLDNINIRDLKQLISKEIGKDFYMINLIFQNRFLDDENFLNEVEIKNETILYYTIKLNEEVEILMELKRYWNLSNNWSRDNDLSEWYGIKIHENSNSSNV